MIPEQQNVQVLVDVDNRQIINVPNPINCALCLVAIEHGNLFLCEFGHTICEICIVNLEGCRQCAIEHNQAREALVNILDVRERYWHIPEAQNFQNLLSNAFRVIDAVHKKKISKLDKKRKPKIDHSRNRIEDIVISKFFEHLSIVIPRLNSNNNVLSNSNSIISNRKCITDHSVIYRKPVQVKGTHHKCEFCNIMFPICRLYNHVRYHHKESYEEIKIDGTFNHNSFVSAERKTSVGDDLGDYIQAFKVVDYGLFFLKLSYKKDRKSKYT